MNLSEPLFASGSAAITPPLTARQATPGSPFKPAAGILRVVALAALSTLASGLAAADLIPADRLVDWTPGVMVGVPGGIPTDRTRLIDVTQAPYNADKTGNQDATGPIQSAVNAAQGGDIVYIPAGTYTFSGGISLKSGITLRGAGIGRTTLIPRGGVDFIKISNYTQSFWAEDAYNDRIIPAGVAKGSTVLTVSDTSNFNVGWMAQISHQSSTDPYDNPIETSPWSNSNGFAWLRRQKVRIVAKTATTLTISPGLYAKGTKKLRVSPALYHGSSVGVEGLSIDMNNSTGYAGITYGGISNSWIKDVKIWGTKNYSVVISDCLQSEIRGCYFDELNHIGSSGAGLLMHNSSGILVEDNIFTMQSSSIEVDHGCSGNVFGYNLILSTANSIALNANHGPHNSYNLYEGNVMTTFISDGYHGSASHDTLYRNWIIGTRVGDQIGWAIALKRFSRSYSLVGNIIGAPNGSMGHDGVSLGQPNMGNSYSSGTAPTWTDWGKFTGPAGYQELDTGVAQTTIRTANYNYGASAIPAVEALGALILQQSLYRTNKPSWFGELKWPAVDATLTTPNPSYEMIPAGYRYARGTQDYLPGGTPMQSPSNVKIQVIVQ